MTDQKRRAEPVAASRVQIATRAFCLVFALFCCTELANAQCRFLPDRAHREITYRFHPEVTPYGLILHVTLETQTEPSGQLLLKVPAQWAGEQLHAVSNLRTVTPGATLTDGENANSKLLHARPGRPVIVAFDVTKDWTGALAHPKQFHPVLLPTYLEFTGSNGLVEPEQPDFAEVVTNFDWQGLTPGWALATSFGASAPGENLKTKCQSVLGPWREVDQGLYAAGDYRIDRFQINGKPAVLAVRGTWNFTDAQAIKSLQEVIGTVRTFWHDDDFPYFLVTLKPYDQDRGSSDGSAFTHAFWMYLSKEDSFNNLLPQLAHEAFHEWNSKRMGSMSSTADRETEWFHEGFTDYYGHLLVYRSGAESTDIYIKSLNRDLARFNANANAYVRGRMIALWLDGTIREESGAKHSLDDVMFNMVRGAKQPLTEQRILETMRPYITAEDARMLARAAAKEGEVPAPQLAPWVGACERAASVDQPTYDLGFDLNASKAKMEVTGVTDGGPAYAAGVRNGQTLKGWSVVSDPDKIASVSVGTDAGTKKLTFYPRGNPVKVWQYIHDVAHPCKAPFSSGL